MARADLTEAVFAEHVFHIEEARASSAYLATRFVPEGPPISHACYVGAIRDAAARSPLPLRVGIELDVRPEDAELERATFAYVDGHAGDWDVVIGSVHVIDGDLDIHAPLDTPADIAWRDYLERQLFAVESGRYDVVSHPVRLAHGVPAVPDDLPALLETLAARAARADVAVEVNGTDTELRPDLVAVLVDALARHRTPVSLGSDAHRPAAAGRAAGAVRMLAEAGIGEVVAFEGRRRRSVPLMRPAGV
jgi:histidinol phosphatase-like PHP family hydrolase